MNMKQQLEYMVQYFHPDKKYGFLRGGQSSSAHAALFGLRESFYTELKQQFLDRAQTAAQTLCNQPQYQQQIKAISLPKLARIVALGDSLTDDLQSWFEIIKCSFNILRPEDEIKFFNLAVSGDTSTQMLGSIVSATDYKADLYLCLIGINDARIQGGKQYKPCTSLHEVAANFESLMQFAANETQSPWLWIAPPGVIEERIEQHDFFKPIRAFWSNQYVNDIADIICQQAELVVDLRAPFKQEKSQELYDSDGLHWSIHGQSLAASLIVKQLAQIDISSPPD